jgi:hypothetical protein
MTDIKQYTTRTNMLWVQPDGAGGALSPLACADLDELSDVETALTPLFCWNDDRTGKEVIGETLGDPEKISFSITMPEQIARSLLETVGCPFTIYWTQSLCGRVDDFGNIERGEIVTNVRRVGRVYRGVSNRADNPSEVMVNVEAWPPLLDIDTLKFGRSTTVEILPANDVFGRNSLHCVDACGSTLEPGEEVVAVNDAAGGAPGDAMFSDDFGDVFTSCVGATFANGFHIKAVTQFPYGTGVRTVIGRDGLIGGAVQGQMGYSDNDGATAFTLVNIGGAAAQHGPMYGHALFSLDRYHIWCATNLGYIYKSIDAGLTWVAKETGTIHAGTNYFVHFADKSYGISGGAAGVISLTDDGGETWYAGGIPAASLARCGWRQDKYVCWVGLDNGALYKSTTGGMTWVLQAPGFAAGQLPRSMWWVNAFQGFIAVATAAPLGQVYRTNNGGSSWEALTTPVNLGLNSIWAPTARLVFAVGPQSAAPISTVILKGVSAYV